MIDTHLHFCDTGRYGELVSYCDGNDITHAGLVSLPRPDGTTYNEQVSSAMKRDPSRFFGYGCLSYREIMTVPAGKQVARLKEEGFSGLKLWAGKPLIEMTLGVPFDSFVIHEAIVEAGRLGMPVLIHVADPPEFWKPEGLYEEGYDPFSAYLKRFEALLLAHRDTTFIAAHLLFLAGGDLDELYRIMDTYPNLLLDTAPGRWFYRKLIGQKEASIDLFSRYGDRILFGSDALFFSYDDGIFPYMDLEENGRTVRRIRDFLSTDTMIDDPYPWQDENLKEIGTLDLPESITQKILSGNAKRIFDL